MVFYIEIAYYLKSKYLKMKPMKVAESGIPDLWTESVENGYYIVPYYFLDEKGNEHTVTVYH